MPFLSVPDGRTVSRGVKGHKLTPKMVNLIDLYFSDAEFNMTTAVKMSLYKTKQPYRLACELLQHPLIRKEIERRMNERTELVEVKRESRVQKLLNIIDANEDKNPQAALRGIELAGKSIGMWVDRQEVSG